MPPKFKLAINVGEEPAGPSGSSGSNGARDMDSLRMEKDGITVGDQHAYGTFMFHRPLSLPKDFPGKGTWLNMPHAVPCTDDQVVSSSYDLSRPLLCPVPSQMNTATTSPHAVMHQSSATQPRMPHVPLRS